LNYSKDELAKYDHLFRMSKMYAAAAAVSATTGAHTAASPDESASPTALAHHSYEYGASVATGGVVAGVPAGAEAATTAPNVGLVGAIQQHVPNQPAVVLDHHRQTRLLTGDSLTVGSAKLETFQRHHTIDCKSLFYFHSSSGRVFFSHSI
jgi:hypothetical protein